MSRKTAKHNEKEEVLADIDEMMQMFLEEIEAGCFCVEDEFHYCPNSPPDCQIHLAAHIRKTQLV